MSDAPTTAEKAEIIGSIGDFGDNVLADSMDAIWLRYASLGGRLQFLYTKKDLLDLAMGEVRRRVTFNSPTDVGVDESDLLNNLLKMRQAVERDIAAEKTVAGGILESAAGFVPFTGELLTTGSTSIYGLPGGPDANSQNYRGSPYHSRTRRIS